MNDGEHGGFSGDPARVAVKARGKFVVYKVRRGGAACALSFHSFSLFREFQQWMRLEIYYVV